MHRTRRRFLLALGPAYRGPARRDNGEGAGSGSADGGGGSGSTDGGDAQGADGGQGNDTKAPKIDGEFDPERAKRSLAASREAERAAKQRATAAEKGVQDLKDSLAVALGLKPDPKSDPTALAAQAAKELTDTRAEMVELKTENALMRLAGKAGGDVDALRDSRTFMRSLAEIDPSASGYDQLITDAIKAAVKANPKLATTPVKTPGRQGADHSGGAAGTERPKSLREAFARKNQT
ncbi:hypothetical protein [Micromonospora sp. NPDC004704]